MKTLHQKKIRSKKEQAYRGFTLIELLVAVSILIILTIFIAGFFVDVSKIYLGSLSSRSAQQNTRIALETISRYAKQARTASWDNSNKSLGLTIKDDTGSSYNVTIRRIIVQDTYGRTDPITGAVLTQGQLVMTINPGGINNKLLTSENLNISDFLVTYSPGIPAILNIELRARIEEGNAMGKSFEKGSGGTGEMIIRTSVSLKGQYY